MNKISTIVFLLMAGLLVACGNTLTPTPPVATSTVVVATETNQPTLLPVEFVWKITGAPNPFNAPVGIALDPQGYLYIMDTKNARIQKFDSDGKFILMWGSPGSGEGQFSITVPDEGRLAVDAQGNVLVLDVSNGRVQKFDSNGKFLTQWGTSGKGDGQFIEASDIAIDQQNNVYVVDYQNRVVQKFDENGKFLLRWGKTGLEDGEFAGLFSVAIDPDGNVLVADEVGRIQKFDRDGKFLLKIPLEKIDDRSIDTWNIAIDTQGNIYVADNGGIRIVKFNRNGEIVASWRGGETGAGLFNNLQDIAVDIQGNVYISDRGSNLVQKFKQIEFQP
jgi:tripartite motif-containing protein 71